ncbi:MAG: hypothetical protein AAF432_03955 [Planctomycetota bacterium]
MRRAMGAAASVLMCASAHAAVVGVEFTIVDFSSGFVFADGSIHTESAHLVPDARPPGTKTFRMWAIVESPDDTVAFLGADPDDSVTIQFLKRDAPCTSPSGPAFNTPLGTDIDAPDPSVYTLFPEVAYDSWLTIGHDGSESTSGGTIVLDGPWLKSWAAGELFNETMGGIFDITPNAGEDVVAGGSTGYRVLLGQFTMDDNAVPGFRARIGGGGNAFDVCGGIPCNLTPEFFGACCITDAPCDEQIDPQPRTCAGLGGIFHPGTCCDDVVCPPVIGACCLPDETCSIEEPDDCGNLGGSYLGDGVSCRCPQDVASPEVDSFPYGFADGRVDIVDLSAVISSFGRANAGSTRDFEPQHPDGTFGNGEVNIDEILSVINAWGPCASVCAGQ